MVDSHTLTFAYANMFCAAQSLPTNNIISARQQHLYPGRTSLIFVSWDKADAWRPSLLHHFVIKALVDQWPLLNNHSPRINNLCAQFIFEKQRERIVNAINTFYNLCPWINADY